MTLEGHAMESAGSGEEQAVAGAEDGGHDEGVDEMGEAADFHTLHGDDVGTEDVS